MIERMGNTQTAEIKVGQCSVELLPVSETEGWQLGAINPGERTDKELLKIADEVVRSIVAVDPKQLKSSDCTDGRFRVSLGDGISPVPIREKIVGADIVMAFSMAEALGSRFYGNDKANIKERVFVVADFLADNDIELVSHAVCGGAGSFTTVVENSVKFAAIPNMRERIKKFVPMYQANILDTVAGSLAQRINTRAYDGYSGQLITDAVMKHSGSQGIAHYADTGRGVQGHEELAIVRIDNMPGFTIDTNKLAESSQVQVFTVNNSRIEMLAGLFGRGHDADYTTSHIAGELFSNAGHGTLGRNLRTLIIGQA